MFSVSYFMFIAFTSCLHVYTVVMPCLAGFVFLCNNSSFDCLFLYMHACVCVYVCLIVICTGITEWVTTFPTVINIII